MVFAHSYKHVVDGVRRITMEGKQITMAVHSQLRDQNAKIINVLPMTEGFFKLWRGASLNVMRAVLMTLSQVRIYYAS